MSIVIFIIYESPQNDKTQGTSSALQQKKIEYKTTALYSMLLIFSQQRYSNWDNNMRNPKF